MTEVNKIVDEIWSKLLKGCQDGEITVGDAYRMKSDLFDSISSLLSGLNEAIEKAKIKGDFAGEGVMRILDITPAKMAHDNQCFNDGLTKAQKVIRGEK